MSYIETWDDVRITKDGNLRAEKWLELKRRYSLAIHVSNKRHLGGKLSDLLWNTWDCDTSDPKDKVFAILGLVANGYESGIEVDYSKDMLCIFKETASAIITQEKSLDVLLAGCSLSRSEGMPSWVPD
jgi:hypothetical protein